MFRLHVTSAERTHRPEGVHHVLEGPAPRHRVGLPHQRLEVARPVDPAAGTAVDVADRLGGTAGSCFSDIGRARCRRGSGAYPAPKPPRPSDLLSTPTLSERRLLIEAVLEAFV